MEEAINRINCLLDLQKKIGIVYRLDAEDSKAIKELLKAYKDLQEIEQYHKAENGKLKERVTELEDELAKFIRKGE